MTLLHHGLVKVPGHGPRPAIYWLRLYEGRNQGHLAVVTEVPGNPGYSTANGVSLLEEYIRINCGVGDHRLRLFLVTPLGQFSDERESITEAVVRRGERAWPASSRAKVESAIGGPLTPLPPHDELYGLVLAAGGGITREVLRDVFEPVPVGELPFPHGLYQCNLFRHFQQVSGFDETGRTHAEAIALGKRFTLQLAEDARKSCRYHKADWRSIADASVEIITRIGPAGADLYQDASLTRGLPPTEGRWLASLFDNPIVISGGGYTNGQHRGCALRFSGAAAAAVVVRTDSLGEVADDWTYLGQG